MEVNSEISAWGFHPKYQYRDGEDRIATSNIQHNRLDEFADEYGRRSPWPCFVLKKETLVDENDRTIFNQHLLERRNALQDVGAANFKVGNVELFDWYT